MKKKRKVVRERHVLYEAAVQSVDADLDFFERIYRREHKRRFKRLREDFCGTAALACDWARRRDGNQAWGVDLHGPTLDWGRRHRLSRLEPEAARRVHLIRDDVLRVDTPKVDVLCALNFSYSVFKERRVLGEYLRRARRALRPGGILFLDAWGGPETMGEHKERRRIPAGRDWDGTKIPAFNYYWEQASFNPVDHRIVCHIHFKLRDGAKLKRAFTYDWRLWMLPELQELLLEAGFARTEVYVEGWDDEADDTDGIFRRRKRFDNDDAWVAYVVGLG